MRNRIQYCFGAGIFLVGAVSAHAAQDRPAASTHDALTTALGRETTTQGAADRPELHHRNPRYQLCKDDVPSSQMATSPCSVSAICTWKDKQFLTLLN